MEQINHISTTLTYIDNNLKTHISADELADIAGYSLWHFCRLFTQAVGMPVAAYICKQRIDRVLAEMSSGRKAVDVVLEYGFDTYAGFYKAFVRVYGCSPKKYLSLYGKQTKKSGGLLMIQEHEIRAALTNWDVPGDLPIHDVWIMDGAKVSGNVWSFGDGYILKAGPRDEMLKNLRIVRALAKQGFTASLPVPTKIGEDYLEGEHIFTLTHKIPGAPLSKENRFGENRRKFGFKYGQSIAKLHCALAEIEADIMPDEVNQYKLAMEWALPETRKQNKQWRMGLTDDFFDDFAKTFGDLYEKLPKQLIHRDIHPSNILFNNDEISGFIDFDFCERRIRILDPCYCSTGLLVEWTGVENIKEKWPVVLEGILHGYDSINPLTSEEKQAVFYVLCSIQMVCVAYFESVDEFKELAKRNREMLSYIVENKVKIQSIF
ncbi:MAG: phosphotransferase [Defluviitaleaceae bacterium]|nr:phosphotransferase [Defluviitaleaceae bacterium]